MEGKNVILHIFMYNVMSDFSGARQVSEGRVKGKLAKNRIKWDIFQKKKRFSLSKKGFKRFFDN